MAAVIVVRVRACVRRRASNSFVEIVQRSPPSRSRFATAQRHARPPPWRNCRPSPAGLQSARRRGALSVSQPEVPPHMSSTRRRRSGSVVRRRSGCSPVRTRRWRRRCRGRPRSQRVVVGGLCRRCSSHRSRICGRSRSRSGSCTSPRGGGGASSCRTTCQPEFSRSERLRACCTLCRRAAGDLVVLVVVVVDIAARTTLTWRICRSNVAISLGIEKPSTSCTVSRTASAQLRCDARMGVCAQLWTVESVRRRQGRN